MWSLVQKKNISKPINSLLEPASADNNIYTHARRILPEGSVRLAWKGYDNISQCLSSFSPKRRQGKFFYNKNGKKDGVGHPRANTRHSYGLFKAADKKLLKRDELTSGPTSSEKINEM